MFEQIGWATAAVFLTCIVCLFAAAWGPVILTVPMIVLMFIGLAFALVTVSAQASAMSWAKYVCVVVPLSLYCGWVTVAMFANASEVLPGYGFDRFGLNVVTWTLAALSCAALIAIGMTWATASPAYAATIVWALVAIAVATYARGPVWPVVAAALAVSIFVCIVLLVRMRMQPSP